MQYLQSPLALLYYPKSVCVTGHINIYICEVCRITKNSFEYYVYLRLERPKLRVCCDERHDYRWFKAHTRTVYLRWTRSRDSSVRTVNYTRQTELCLEICRPAF
jgi:hypothetical protein